MNGIASYTRLVSETTTPHPSVMEPNARHRPRYRWRTWMRGHVPWALVGLFPKGSRDCGRHHWHNHDNVTDHCYHCVVGTRPHQEKQVPLDEDFRMGLAREAARGCGIAAEVLTIMHRQDREQGRSRWRPLGQAPTAR
jgi:hypothetical protein